MSDLSLLSYSLKFRSYYRQMEHWTQDIFQRDRYVKFVNCHIFLSKIQFREVMSRDTVKAPMAEMAEIKEHAT